MDVVLSIYNYFLLILFCIPLTISLIGFLQTKRPAFLSTVLLFVLYIADNLVIYMTEVIDWFSASYDLKFMTVPAFKTLIYAGTFICLVKIVENFLNRKTPAAIYSILAVILAILLFIPLLPNSACKVWLYYFPCQVFTFIFGLYTLHIMKERSDWPDTPGFALFQRLALLTVIFSIIIVIEDTIVIFNFDIYDNLIVKINNRSLSEDLLSIIYAVIAIRIMVPLFQVSAAESQTDRALFTESSDTQNDFIPEETVQSESGKNTDIETVINPAGDYSKFFLFCREYQLTTREQDIFRLLLDHKDNTEISESLFISLGTVKAHVHNIFSKLEVSKRQQLIDKYENFSNE